MMNLWIRRNHSAELLIFLNGWGMDACIFEHVPPPADFDVLMFYNYTQLDALDESAMPVEDYDRVIMIAWSMGVWAAGEAFAPFAGQIDHAIAINGTADPVSDSHGIPPAIFRATADSLSEQTRNSFYRRMCNSADYYRRFLETPPARSAQDQKIELEAIALRTKTSHLPQPYPFDRIFIGSRDRIMTSENQIRYWANHTPRVIPDMPHYPFFDLTWEELLTNDADNR